MITAAGGWTYLSHVQAATGSADCLLPVLPEENVCLTINPGMLSRKGMDLYFKRHDGQAVTCDDFRNAMADANDQDLSAFAAW